MEAIATVAGAGVGLIVSAVSLMLAKRAEVKLRDAMSRDGRTRR